MALETFQRTHGPENIRSEMRAGEYACTACRAWVPGSSRGMF